MKSLLFGLTLLLTPMVALADEAVKPTPEIAGDWQGQMQGPDGPITIVFHVGDVRPA